MALVLWDIPVIMWSQIVMDDHQRPDGIPVTRFTLQSIYAQADDERLEFEYESGNTNITVICNFMVSFPDYLNL